MAVEASRAGTPSSWLAGRRPVALAAAVLIVGLFVFCHPYFGLHGDATIYVMRALADLDPSALGRDLMVVDDGQMRFSLFPFLLRPLVYALGSAQGAVLVAALGSAAWLTGLAALARQLAPGRIAWAMVAMVAVLPLTYGDTNIFFFAETSAVPRPFAEAAVMLALAAMLAGRVGSSVAALVFAGLIHPIMAMAGFGVVALVLLWRLPSSWRVAAILTGAAGVVVAATLGFRGVAPFERLVVRPDADWLEMLRSRSPHLFPTLWTSDSFSPLLAQAATIVIAAHHAATPQRRLLVAALVVCLASLVSEAILGDALHLLLFIQTQAWRTTWLVGVLGGCALAFCTGTLWVEGARGRVILALLTLTWFFQPNPVCTATVAALALVIDLADFGASRRLTMSHAIVALVVAAILSAYWVSGSILGYRAFLRDMPPGLGPSTIYPLRNNLQSFPLCAAIAAWLVAGTALAETATAFFVLAAVGLGLLAAGAFAWDQRSVAQVYLESPHAPAALADLAAGRRPEVFWIDSNADTWFALRQPQYFSPQQAVSIVFSQSLAREWMRRSRDLVALGLVPRSVYTPWKPAADDDRERITQASIDALCSRPGGPGLVVFPRNSGDPNLRGMIDWPLPAPLFKPKDHVSGLQWERIEGFGIVACGPVVAR